MDKKQEALRQAEMLSIDMNVTFSLAAYVFAKIAEEDEIKSFMDLRKTCLVESGYDRDLVKEILHIMTDTILKIHRVVSPDG